MNESFDLMAIQQQLSVVQATEEIRACNEVSARYGLVLTDRQIQELVSCRAEVLRETGRVEFGGGILPKLIRAFCDSPYLEPSNYETVLAELQEAFYYFKNESLDRFTDDELMEAMVAVFHGRAQGSAEYLIGTSLEALCRYARAPFDPQDAEEMRELF